MSTVLRALGSKIFSLGGGSVAVAVITVVLWKVYARVHGQIGWRTAWVGTMLAGYALVFIVTPRDLAWHLATAGDRLLIQIWPAFLIALFGDGLSIRDATATRG